MWLIFIVLHLVGLVSYSLILRKSILNKVDKLTLATIMQTGIAIPMVFVLFINPPSLSAYDLKTGIIVVITALLVIALHYTNVKALQYLEVGVYSVVYNLRILFTTILGILFLNEEIVWLRILGGLLILLAIFIVKQKGKKSLTTIGLQWGLVASLVISFLNFSEKYLLNNISYLEYAVPVMLIAATLMWAVLLLRNRKVDYSIFKQRQTISLMGFRALSAYCATLAFAAGGLLSVTSYLSSLSVVIIVILGALLLGERDYLKRKIIAVAISVIGLSLILLTSL